MHISHVSERITQWAIFSFAIDVQSVAQNCTGADPEISERGGFFTIYLFILQK